MNRKAIKAAMFNLVGGVQFDLGEGLVGFTTKSPKLKHWNDIKAGQQPAFFLTQGRQSPQPPPAPGGPQAWHLHFTGYIYVNTSGETDPADALNPILDAIDPLFVDPFAKPNTLGGLVQWVRMVGDIETFEGTLGDQEVALINFQALVA